MSLEHKQIIMSLTFNVSMGEVAWGGVRNVYQEGKGLGRGSTGFRACENFDHRCSSLCNVLTLV